MASNAIRAVVVRRPTDYEQLISTHATRAQAEFFLAARSQSIEETARDHETVEKAVASVRAAIPLGWRRTAIDRAELSRFLFEPEDVVIVVGQDGLVANVAKYLAGQPVLGINPLPHRFDGPLVRHPPAAARDLLADIDAQRAVAISERVMVRVALDDGQSLRALNEVFIGHRSHQSARYRIAFAQSDGNESSEKHSSSGIICCSGTGASGWAASIAAAIGCTTPLPKPTEPRLAFFVREAWRSRTTGTSVVRGPVDAGHQLRVTSEMNTGGVVFGDGIEDDFLAFDWGRVATVEVAEDRLRLVE